MKGQDLLKTGALRHGGIMVNYQCTAACRHCLYACSPARTAGYISSDIAEAVCGLLKQGGCGSVHIGGGEPFLDIEGLLMTVRELRHEGIRLEYIETNAYWAAHEDEARNILKQLQAEGVEALCISVDPFHAEYVPYAYPLRLHALCNEIGMGDFLWKPQFIPVLSSLDSLEPHSRAQMAEKLSSAYIGETARAYGIRLGGRAVNIEQEYARYRQVEELLDDAPCYGLLSTDHFHVDLQGYFIPPGCTGLRLPLADAINGTAPEKYPVFEALYYQGIRGLLHLAGSYGFRASQEGYPSKCNLCFHIRRYLGQYAFQELDPEHYEAALQYY